jgi:hypothetical protein
MAMLAINTKNPIKINRVNNSNRLLFKTSANNFMLFEYRNNLNSLKINKKRKNQKTLKLGKIDSKSIMATGELM